MTKYDVIIVGGGPAGYTAAIRGAQLGAKVLLVEKDEIGGVCLNRGCIPTKTLLETSRLISILKNSGEYGVEVGSYKLDFEKLVSRKNFVVKKLVKGIEYLLESWDVKVLKGEGRIRDLETLKVKLKSGSVETYNFKNLIVATGSQPLTLKVPGSNLKSVISSEQALELDELPEEVLIIGGGAVGVELATILSGLGSKITLVEIMPRILPFEDRDVSLRAGRTLKKRGIKLYTSSRLVKFKEEKNKNIAFLETPRGTVELGYDVAIVAIGRKPTIEGLGLEGLGVNVERGRIVVDEHMKTSIPRIYAAGDVTGGYMFAHVAFQEGIVAVENCLGIDSTIDYTAVPRCIYSTPEIACVGLTEEEALKQGFKVVTGKFQVAASSRALTLGETEGFIKTVVDSVDDKILGVHAIAPNASEIISEYTMCIRLGLKVGEVEETIHPHPTVSEAFKEAILDSKLKAIHKVRRKKS